MAIEFYLNQRENSRTGKALVLVVVALPAVLAIVGLVLDAGLMISDTRNLQHAADAGATAGAMEMLLGRSPAEADGVAKSYIRQHNGIAQSGVTVRIPPAQGSYAGQDGYIEVLAEHAYRTRLIHIAGAAPQQSLAARAVAGHRPSTAGAAIIVLDSDPPPLVISGIPVALALPSLRPVIGGLEVLGSGTVQVDGAVLVNTTWGGVDENGNPAGDGPGPPYGVSCTPLLSSTRLEARDIRVAGGVDDPDNYGHFESGEKSPLRANRMAVPDPFETLPLPTTSSDPVNVSPELRGGVQVVALPLLGPPTVLQPGVYDWIEVLSGQAIFEPGVYIIRGVNPVTSISLNFVGGEITAEGVMFYLTNSAVYDAASGTPDDADDAAAAPPPTVGTLVPSAVVNAGLMNSRFSPLSSASSPFNGVLVYQRRNDRRPILLVHQNLALGGALSGTIYAKRGHAWMTGAGTYDLRIVAGTARLMTISGMTIAPSNLLPPARDVFLVE